MRLGEIAEYIKGTLNGDGNIEITGLAGINEAQAGDLTFLANFKYSVFMESTNASAILLSKNEKKPGKLAYIECEDPYFSFASLIKLIYRNGVPKWPAGIASSAQISESSRIGENATILPFAYIGDNSRIGNNAKIGAGVFIGENVTIGDNAIIYPNVSIIRDTVIGNNVIIHAGAVIGADGFGFVKHEGMNVKIPQVGAIDIADDVEIGANVCIDRATLGATKIAKGTKIDDLVMIAHNVEIGSQSLIVAQVGISGSVKIGNNVTLAGQVGAAGHLEVGDNTVVAAKAGISKNIPPNSFYSGHPARPYKDDMKQKASLERLPSLIQKIKELEERLTELEGKN